MTFNNKAFYYKQELEKGINKARDSSRKRKKSKSGTEKTSKVEGLNTNGTGAAARNRAAASQGIREAGTASAFVSGLNTPAIKKLNSNREGTKKVAKFLMLIPKEEAAKVLKKLSEKEIEKIMKELSQIQKISREESGEVFSEFGFIARVGAENNRGGAEAARSILKNAFGEEKAEQILLKSAPRETTRIFEFLTDLETHQLKLLLKKETPAVISIIFAYTEPGFASRLFQVLDSDVQKEVVLRMAKMDKIETSVLEKIAEALREKVRRQGRVVSEDLDGRSALASILRNMDSGDEEEILEALEAVEPDLSKDIRDRLFTIDTLLFIDDKDLQTVLKEFSDRQIALILKGKNEEIRSKVLKNVSRHRAEFISDEYRNMGPQLKKDVDEAGKDFLNYLKTLESEGKLTIHQESEEYV